MARNDGLNSWNQMRRTFITCEVDGEELTLTPEQWAEREDTYRLKPNRDRKPISGASIRNLYQKRNRGDADVTMRQVVGLDDYYPWNYKLTTIKRDNHDEYDDDFKYRQAFLSRRLCNV